MKVKAKQTELQKPYADTIQDKPARDDAAKRFAGQWAQAKPSDPKWVEMVMSLAEGIRKGYFRASPEGSLLVTEKGAWREWVRNTHHTYRGAR